MAVPRIAAQMNRTDAEILTALSRMRCLTQEQIGSCAAASMDGRSLAMRLAWMDGNGLIETVKSKGNLTCWYLTPRGVRVQRALAETFGMPPGTLASSVLRMDPVMVPHQHALNRFSIRLLSKFPEYAYAYRDGVSIGGFTACRPDAVLEIPGLDLFLEMDMGTERRRALAEKADHYRLLMDDRAAGDLCPPPAAMFFILNSRGNRDPVRKQLVSQAFACTIPDLMDERLRIFAGGEEELLQQAERLLSRIRVTPAQHLQAGAYPAAGTRRKFEDLQLVSRGMSWPVCLLTEEGSRWVLADYDRLGLSALNLAARWHIAAAAAEGPAGEEPLLVIVRAGRPFRAEELRSMQCLGARNVWYCPDSWHMCRSIADSLYTFDPLGNRLRYCGRDAAVLSAE